MTTTYECNNDRYCPEQMTFDSMQEFLDYCTLCFGEAPELTRTADGWFDEHEEHVLTELTHGAVEVAS